MAGLLFQRGLAKPLFAWLGILVVVAVVVGLGGALLFINSGIFNVGATVKDNAVLSWVLINTREASIKARAQGLEPPAPATEAQIDRGFQLFRLECSMCHIPPGREETLMAKGLNPQAPELAELVEDMTDGELFWATKNGIRFTGMPAWTDSYSDEDLWNVVAFMREYVERPAADYDAIDQRVPAQPM